MKTYCKWLIVVGAIWGCAAALGTGNRCRKNGADAECEETRKIIDELRQQIMSLNLINGLNLTQEQIQQILALAKRQDAVRERYKRMGSDLVADSKTLLADLKVVLAKNEPVPQDLALKVHKAETREKTLRMRMGNELSSIGRNLDSILTEAQMAIVQDFKPCILPPKKLSDPVRAGQAGDSSRSERILRRIREIPDHVYKQNRDRIVVRHLAIGERHHGKLTEEEKAKERERILAVIDKARSMSDMEFEMNKADLAKQFMPYDKIGSLLKQIDQAKPGGTATKAQRFLLSKAGVAILRARAAQ